MCLEAYYKAVPEARLDRLRLIEAAIRKVAPAAVASLDYKLPTFKTESGWIACGDQKHYISVYTCSEEKLEPYLKAYPKSNCGKGCLRFKDSEEIDFAVLSKVIEKALL